jgi:hypothetical protein
MVRAIPFLILAVLGVLILVHRERFGRALRASSRGFSQELGGPFAWWSAPPDGSRRARFQDGFSRFMIFVLALSWIGFGIWGVARAVSK